MTNPSVAKFFDLKGKSAIVTGGALGIGQAIALRLAEAGATITISDVNLDAANATVEQIRAQGGKSQAVLADAANIADAKRVVEWRTAISTPRRRRRRRSTRCRPAASSTRGT